MSKMQYNICDNCKAGDGRAGLLIGGLCECCWTTKKTGRLSLLSYLDRSSDEVARIAALLDGIDDPSSDDRTATLERQAALTRLQAARDALLAHQAAIEKHCGSEAITAVFEALHNVVGGMRNGN